MMKHVILIVAFLCAGGSMYAKNKTWCNPLNISYRFSLDGAGYREAADPSVVCYEGKYWLFASKSGGYWWSDDLLEWNFVKTNVLPAEDYAPTVMAYKGWLYFLASFESKGALPLFRTRSPLEDKWERVTDKKFKYDTYTNGTKCIDPMLLADGEDVYMYWGCSNKTPIWCVKLDPDNEFEAVSEPYVAVDSDTLNRGWERRQDGKRPWVEGAWVNKVNGKYYLQYAASGTERDWYSDGYYVSDSPLQGFRFDLHNPFSMKPTGFVKGAGHSSTFQDVKGNYWHISTNCLSVKHDYERRLSIFPVLFDKDGVPYCCTLWGDYPQRMPDGKFVNPEELFTGWMLLSYNKTYSASSGGVKHKASAAFDENMRTYWLSDGGDFSWIEVDMEGLKDVYAVQVNFSDPGAKYKGIVEGKGYEYKIQASVDGKNWVSLSDKAENRLDAPHDYMELPEPVKARYVRLADLSSPFGTVAVSEFRVFGKGTGNLPGEVKGFNVSRDSEDRVKAVLSWDAVSGANGYVIKYGVDADKLYHNFIVYGKESYDTFLLNAEPAYYFSIASFNDNGVSAYSEVCRIE